LHEVFGTGTAAVISPVGELFYKETTHVINGGQAGEVYNVGAGNEHTNLDVVRTILQHLGKPESLLRFVTDRPGHDRRYAIDASKLRTKLGWHPEIDFDSGISDTITWYIEHQAWLDEVVSGEYREYYRKLYAGR